MLPEKPTFDQSGKRRPEGTRPEDAGFRLGEDMGKPSPRGRKVTDKGAATVAEREIDKAKATGWTPGQSTRTPEQIAQEKPEVRKDP